MADLRSIAELVWKQMNPNPGNETKITRGQVIETAKTEYAYWMWRKIKEDKAAEGESNVPSYLLDEKEVEVQNNYIDISDIGIMRSIDQDLWLQDVRPVEVDAKCECQYIKTTFNTNKALCDDDSIPDTAKTYYPLGKKIIFPRGTHSERLVLVYAKNATGIDEEIEVEEAIGAQVRRSLMDIYLGKVQPEDKTNNTNPDI